MSSGSRIDDPRLRAPQCQALQPTATAHQNPWFSVMNRGGYYTVEHHERQVMVIPVVEGSQVLMVSVYRPVLNDTPWELPAGGCRPDETPTVAARRELAEEAGIWVEDLARFQSLLPLAILARSPMLPYSLLVHLSQAEFDHRVASDHEIAGVRCLSFDRFEQAVATGEIYVGQSIAVVCQYLFALRQPLGVSRHADTTPGAASSNTGC